jgi:hypothetical protein
VPVAVVSGACGRKKIDDMRKFGSHWPSSEPQSAYCALRFSMVQRNRPRDSVEDGFLFTCWYFSSKKIHRSTQYMPRSDLHTCIITNIIFLSLFQRPRDVVAIKAITKKNLAKSQNLLGKEIKILKVSVKFLMILYLCTIAYVFVVLSCPFNVLEGDTKSFLDATRVTGAK